MIVLLLFLLAAEDRAEEQRIDRAITRGAEWMAGYAQAQPLNFDAVIVLALAAERHDSPALRLAFERANARQDRDRGHPMRRFFEPHFRLPPELSRGWQPPAGATWRVNPDRVVTEALHCPENGWRKETSAYVCGPMRDGGGYYTTHGLWALILAKEGRCAAGGELEACFGELRSELAAAQPQVFVPWTTLDIDLYAERLVMLLQSDGDPRAAGAGVESLVELQNGDGSWGIAAADEPPYLRFHATMMSVWALSLARKRTDQRMER